MRVAPGAWRYAGAVFLLAVPAVFISAALGVAFVALGGGVLWFFRDPERVPPPSGIVAPADGRVTVVREEAGRVRVGVFMNVTDVHVNRAPLAGVVEAVDHQPGAHRPAFSKDSARNERVRIDLGEYAVILIAGAFARRITPYVDAGDAVTRGQRIGHIAFGSRADVLLPDGVSRAGVLVETGDRVRAGETVIAPAP